MLRTLIGLGWVFFGLIFLFRPGMFRFWLRWRSLVSIRWTLFWLALGAGFSLIFAVLGMPGWLPKILGLVGLVAILKAFFFLKCESSTWLVELLADLPEEAYRWIALVYLAIGLALIFVL